MLTNRWKLKGFTPYKVQKAALQASDGKQGFGFLMEMGLGKTSTVLSEFLSLRDAGLCSILIVVCPNDMKSGWVEEIQKYKTGLAAYVWETDTFIGEGDGDVFIFNYESMLWGGAAEIEALLRQYSCYMTLDESVCIKNFKSQTAKKILSIKHMPAFRRIMTGMPRPENVMDLWSQLQFIGLFKGVNPYAFRNRYAVMGGWMNKKVIGSANQEELAHAMSQHCFVATKKDWTDLPEKRYMPPIEVDLSDKQKKLYRQMEQEFLIMVEDAQVQADQVITALTKLQQISSGFVMDEEGKPLELVSHAGNPKLRSLIEHLDMIDGKAIVFCQFDYTHAMLMEALGKRAERMGKSIAYLRGGMSTEDITEQKRIFNTDDDCTVMVMKVQLKYGHTLLGSPECRCSTTFYFENMWSLNTRAQSEDRNHRHGQDRMVNYFDFVSSKVERKAVKALVEKREVSDEFMSRVKTEEQSVEEAQV